MPGFSKSKGNSMMTPFDMFNQAFSSQGKSRKSSFGLPNLPSLPGNGKNGQSSSGDMLGTMCGMMSLGKFGKGALRQNLAWKRSSF